MTRLTPVLGLLAVLACNDSTGPSDDLTGHWELIGYSDAGVAGITTGSAVFRANGTFSIDGTVTYPSEPTEPIQAAGTWSVEGTIVTLDTGSESGRWIRSLVGGDILLTLEGSQPPTTILLRRAGLEGVSLSFRSRSRTAIVPGCNPMLSPSIQGYQLTGTPS